MDLDETAFLGINEGRKRSDVCHLSTQRSLVSYLDAT